MRKAICLISPNPTWLKLGRWQRQLEQNPKNITYERVVSFGIEIQPSTITRETTKSLS